MRTKSTHDAFTPLQSKYTASMQELNTNMEPLETTFANKVESKVNAGSRQDSAAPQDDLL